MAQKDLARLCFEVLDKPPRITYLPDSLRRLALLLLPRIAPRRIAGPAQFFLTAGGMNMTAPPSGARMLVDHFRSLVDQTH